ncbi:MAG TPA: hypothetical protein VF715_19070 [Thermoleophilaceae bacterium]
MLSHSFRRLLVVTACAALLGAGCGGGGGGTERYREDLTEAKEKFDTILEQAAQPGRTPDQLMGDLGRLRRGIAEFKGELAKLDPPAEAENEQKAVDEALAEYDSAVGSTTAAVQAEDRDAVAAEVARVQTTGAALDRALETLVAAVD